jgi:hypothetical protein
LSNMRAASDAAARGVPLQASEGTLVLEDRAYYPGKHQW